MKIISIIIQLLIIVVIMGLEIISVFGDKNITTTHICGIIMIFYVGNSISYILYKFDKWFKNHIK